MKVETCKYATEEYPPEGICAAGYSCSWTVGREDLPPHLSEGGYWIEPEGCEDCACWAEKVSDKGTKP